MNPKHQQQGRRHVTFAIHDAVIDIPNFADMTTLEFNRVYWSREELMAIRQQCKVVVLLMEHGRTRGHCTRGLEQSTMRNTNRVGEIRDNIFHSVLTAQRYQRQSGEDVSEFMAELSRRYSKASVELAMAVAKEDLLSVRDMPEKVKAKGAVLAGGLRMSRTPPSGASSTYGNASLKKNHITLLTSAFDSLTPPSPLSPMAGRSRKLRGWRLGSYE